MKIRILLLNFLIIHLYNSLANSLFEIFFFVTSDLFRAAKVSDRASVAAPAEFLIKKMEQFLFDINHISDFYQTLFF